MFFAQICFAVTDEKEVNGFEKWLSAKSLKTPKRHSKIETFRILRVRVCVCAFFFSQQFVLMLPLPPPYYLQGTHHCLIEQLFEIFQMDKNIFSTIILVAEARCKDFEFTYKTKSIMFIEFKSLTSHKILLPLVFPISPLSESWLCVCVWWSFGRLDGHQHTKASMSVYCE